MARLAARILLVLFLAGACSRGDPARSRPLERPAASSPTSTLDQLAWLPPSTRSITRMRPGSIFLLEWLGEKVGGRKAACWRQIEAGVRAGYMVEIEGHQGSMYALQGMFDRSAVERCAESASPVGGVIHVAVVRDGDLTRLETQGMGTAVLWWRGGGWVISGSAGQIAGLRSAKGSVRSNRCMGRLIAALPDAPVAVARCDALFDNFLGVPAAGWVAGLTVYGSSGITGRVIVMYGSPAEAARAVEVMRSRSFPAIVPGPIRDFLGSLPVSADLNRMSIEIRLTQADFENLDPAVLQKISDDWEAATGTPP